MYNFAENEGFPQCLNIVSVLLIFIYKQNHLILYKILAAVKCTGTL